MLYIFLTLAGVFSAIHFYGFYNFLDLFTVADENPPRIKQQPATVAATPETVPESWGEKEKKERAALESEAYYILTMQGHTIPGIVKYTSNKELIQIIHAAKYKNYKNGGRENGK